MVKLFSLALLAVAVSLTTVVVDYFAPAPAWFVGIAYWAWLILSVTILFPSLGATESKLWGHIIEEEGTMHTFKNISALLVISFLIASNPSTVAYVTQLVGKVLYNGSVAVVTVATTATEKMKDMEGKDFMKAIPGETAGKTPTPPVKKSYKEWLEQELNKISNPKSVQTSPTVTR